MVLAQKLPDVFNGVQLGRIGRQMKEADVFWDPQLSIRLMPSGSIEEESRFLDGMRERFEAFSLSLHPDKTCLIEFGRHAAVDRKKRGVRTPPSS